MPRTARIAPGGMVFHVLNRGIARMHIFKKTRDYEAFERTVRETLEDAPMRICAYCLLPNHLHFLLWPEHDGDLARFMHRLTITHVRKATTATGVATATKTSAMPTTSVMGQCLM